MAASTNLKKCVSLSSIEAEFVTLSKAVITVLLLRNVLLELGVDQVSQRILTESIGSLESAVGGAVKRVDESRHIDSKRNYVMSMLEKDVVKLVSVRSAKMEPDFFDEATCSDRIKDGVRCREYLQLIRN